MFNEIFDTVLQPSDVEVFCSDLVADYGPTINCATPDCQCNM
ncbi:jg22833 [Pararge aegeria aegeria]|uniref:Jg22833 protein n=2 Tax=Pararge aegeria TaxID=116150 RepID=A0A8S4QTS9_9NEOP|nr:jg22833 [Pararge aegeria aegeria]